MNEASVEQLKSINDRLNKTLKEVRAIKEENIYLKKNIEKLREESEKEKSANRSLRADMDALKMAQAISSDEPVDKHARTKINEMVKEIDRCIALLNN